MNIPIHTMARTISLSDAAFVTLRREKQEGESDSDVVMRLVRMAKRKAKDPMAYLRNPPRTHLTPQQYAEFRERMRQADIARARKLYGIQKEEP